MENDYKLQKVEAVCIILIIMVNKLILNVPYYIVDSVGTGALINLIYVGFIGFLLVLLMNKLFTNFQNSDIIDVSEFLGGKFFKCILSIVFIFALFFVTYITLNSFANMIKTIYYDNSPLIFILLFFIIGIVVANIVGFKSIVRTICLIVPFALISILIALFGVYKDFSFDKFAPFLGYNLKSTFVDGLLNIFAFYVMIYYYFLIPLLKNSSDFKKVTITSYIISWILLFLTIISILAIFPISINIEPLNSLYVLSRQIELGDFIQRIDALFILLWLISIFCYLSFCIFMINRIINKLINITNEKMLTFSTSSILFGLALIPFDMATNRFLENSVYKYIILILAFITGFIILILANIKLSIKNKKKLKGS